MNSFIDDLGRAVTANVALKAKHRCPLLDGGAAKTWAGLTEADIVDCVRDYFEAHRFTTWREWKYLPPVGGKLDLLAFKAIATRGEQTWAIEVKCLWEGADKHLKLGRGRLPEALHKDFDNLEKGTPTISAMPLVVWATFSRSDEAGELDAAIEAFSTKTGWAAVGRHTRDLRSAPTVKRGNPWSFVHVVVWRKKPRA